LGVAFCLITAGRCRLDIPGHQQRQLGEGDYVLLAAPPAWTLSDGETVEAERQDARAAAVDFQELFDATGRLSVARDRGQGGPVTRLIGGHFNIDETNSGLLADLMPTVVEIRSSEPSAARLRGVLGLIDDEALSDRPGRTLVIERLLEIMLVEAIRQGRSFGDVRPGLLAGLADRQIAPALRTLHGNVRRNWTVAGLAAVAGMSRSAFSERFTRIVGLPPIDYLLHWRMALAKDALRVGGRRLAEVAFDCGYQSASAFSTAFSRTIGCSPARYAAARRADDEASRRLPDSDPSS
jgi:AraC-like DNA-binding protein